MCWLRRFLLEASWGLFLQTRLFIEPKPLSRLISSIYIASAWSSFERWFFPPGTASRLRRNLWPIFQMWHFILLSDDSALFDRRRREKIGSQKCHGNSSLRFFFLILSLNIIGKRRSARRLQEQTKVCCENNCWGEEKKQKDMLIVDLWGEKRRQKLLNLCGGLN